MLKNTVWHCKFCKCCTNAEEYCLALWTVLSYCFYWRCLSVSTGTPTNSRKISFYNINMATWRRFSKTCKIWNFVTFTIILINIILMRTVVKSTTLHCLSKSQSKIESPALLSLTTGFTSIESAALIIIIIIAMNVLFSFFVVEVFWHFLHCVQGVLR